MRAECLFKRNLCEGHVLQALRNGVSERVVIQQAGRNTVATL